MSGLRPLATQLRTSLVVRFVPKAEVAALVRSSRRTGGHQDAIIIQAARLSAILRRIAQDLRHAEAVLNQEAAAVVRRGASILKQKLMG